MVLTQSINIAHFTVIGSPKQPAAPVLLKQAFSHAGQAFRNCLKIHRQAGSVARCSVGAGFMPAHHRLVRPRAGMKPAPTQPSPQLPRGRRALNLEFWLPGSAWEPMTRGSAPVMPRHGKIRETSKSDFGSGGRASRKAFPGGAWERGVKRHRSSLRSRRTLR